jgi:hypothetical protein
LAIGPNLNVFANTICNAFSFLLARLLTNPAAELLVGRVIYLPRVITVHKAEKNFVKKQMVDPFCGGQRAGHIFELVIGYWLLDIVHVDIQYQVAPRRQIVPDNVALG